MSRELLENLTTRYGYPLLGEAALEPFLQAGGNSVLFFTGDPEKHPEALDVAVILPEIMKQFGDRCRAAVISRSAEQELRMRFAFNAYPALVLLRGDQCLGVIERVKDWAVYLSEFELLLGAKAISVKRP